MFLILTSLNWDGRIEQLLSSNHAGGGGVDTNWDGHHDVADLVSADLVSADLASTDRFPP